MVREMPLCSFKITGEGELETCKIIEKFLTPL